MTIKLCHLLMEVGGFPNETELAALKKVMDGTKGVDRSAFKSGMEKIGARNLYELIVWGLKTGIIQDKPIKLDPNTFHSDKTYSAFPLWLQYLHHISAGEKVDMPKTTIDWLRKKIVDKFKLDGSDQSLIRFAIAAIRPMEPPKRSQVDWRPWTKSTTSLMRIPQTHTGSPVDPYGSITKETTMTKALELLGIRPEEIPSSGKKSERGSFWRKSHETLYHMLELAKNRRDQQIQKLHPLANRHPQNPDQAKQIDMASKQLAVVNAAWQRVRILFARNGYALPGDEELLSREKKQIYIPR